MSTQKIMAIIDPTCEESPAFDRAMASAEMIHAQLHLYTCLNEISAAKPKDEAIFDAQERLELMARQAEAKGIMATTEADWADDWQHQVVNAAARTSATLVLKDCQLHSEVDRQMRETSDWTLLRLAPCPVLLIKNFSDWGHKKVLGAINTLTTDEAHVRLNNQIISIVRQFAENYGSEAHFVSAFTDKNHEPNKASLATQSGVPESHVHVVNTDPAQAIKTTATSIDADLIVIGTIGRSGIKGRVIGNTSEKILDQTHSDVMVLN